MATSSLLDTFGTAKIDTISPQVWDALLRTIEVRLVAIEAKKVAFDDVVKELQAIGLARINEALLPAFTEISELAHLGAIFTATSATTVAIGTGVHQFTITQAERDRFAPTGYLIVRATENPNVGMIGSLVSYHRQTGTLTVTVDSVLGEGSFNAWTVMPSLAPDLGHEARRDNPHEVTAHQVGTYASQEIDLALAMLSTDLGDALGTGLNTRLVKAANLSDLTDAAEARGNLGLKSAATKDVGANAGNVVQLDGSGKAPSSILTFASTAEAQAGTNTDKPMAAARVKEAIQALASPPTDRVTQLRLAYAGYKGTPVTVSGSGGIPSDLGDFYAGAVVTGLSAMQNPPDPIGALGARCRYVQYYTPAAGWVTAAFA